MASASRVRLSLEACGEFHVPGITKESAAKATELLQENHERHHIFFNAEGFHSMYTPPAPSLDLFDVLAALRKVSICKPYQRPTKVMPFVAE
jgi:hypothetical protein